MRKTQFFSNRNNKHKLLFLILALITSLIIIYIFYDNLNQSTPTTDSQTLPILIIDTKGQEITSNKEAEDKIVGDRKIGIYKESPKYNVNLKLYENKSYKDISEKGKINSTIDTDAVINVRGQSSLTYDKKQYTVKFVNKDNSENSLEVLGMPKHDKWVLNGMYNDKSLLRNHLAYKMGRQTMEYSPDTRFVEVYLNEEYIGIYLLVEKIERDKNRIDISKNNEKYRDISFIVSRDKVKVGDIILENDWDKFEDEYSIVSKDTLKLKSVFTTTYPSKQNITEKDKEKIINYINDFEYALRSNRFTNKKEGYIKYIDADSFINYAMINEITKNVDGGEVSAYFYKELGEKMKAGPIWDFDQSMSNTSIEEMNSPTGYKMVNTIWFERLFQDEYFANRYKINYKKYRSTVWTDSNINKMIDEALLELDPAIKRNIDKWYADYTLEDYKKETEDVRAFLIQRLNWMDKNINSVKRIKENVTN